MNKIVKICPVIDIHDFENLIAQKLGYKDNYTFYKSLDNEVYESRSTMDKVQDHIGWDRAELYGNNTFYEMNISENFTADWTPENDYYFDMTEKEAELFNKIDRAVIKLVKDGEIPDEFVLHVWW